MNTRVRSLIVIASAAVASVGAIVASNMAHMATVQLYRPTSGVSNSGTNTINLPYDLGPNITTAKNLMDDITFTKVTSVMRYVKSTDGLQVYTGRLGSGSGFTLTPGECYYVKMKTTTAYTIVGSDLPAVPVSLNAAQAGVSATGNNFVALPFNIKSRTAKELMDDIGFASVTSVSRFVRSSDLMETYTGRQSGEVPFPISFDECYFIKMATTVNYIPSHY